jgi:hypothetical protein
VVLSLIIDLAHLLTPRLVRASVKSSQEIEIDGPKLEEWLNLEFHGDLRDEFSVDTNMDNVGSFCWAIQ